MCSQGGYKDYFLHQGFLFKGKKIYIPQGSLCTSLTHEAHNGGLMGHFGVAKTSDILSDNFFWPSMKKIVITCRQAKSKAQPHGLYTPLPIPTMPWVDSTMDFCNIPKESYLK